jgi:hypothetical protein
MYIEPDLERLVELRGITEASMGLQVMFCPRCNYQYEPGIFGKNECPGCKAKMHVIPIDRDLVEVVRNGLL